MRRLLAAFLVLGLAGCGSTGAPGDAASPPPNAGVNVLLLTIDTLRADHIHCYGYPRPTSPAIDALAARGVLFERARTYWPKTRGSFAALFTSLYAAQHGLTVRDRDLPEWNRTLAEVLRDAGYRTAAAVDNGNLDRALGFAQGFDEYEQVWLVADTEIERTERLTAFAEAFLARSDERPFFLWIHYVNPHTPYEPPADALAPFADDALVPRGPVLDPVVGFHGGVNRHLALPGARWGDYVDRYDGEIAFADRHVGRVLDALDASPYRDRTLVVLTSDHGESLGEHDYYFDHGYDLFEPSLRVPLVLAFPGILPAGARVGADVSTLDIFPTVLDLAQVSFPAGLMGRSVLPVVRGTEARLHELVFFQNDRHQLGLTNGRVKLIAYPPPGDGPFRYELYDLWRDADELDDRYGAARERVAPLVAELERFRTRTVAWQQKTDRRREGAPARTDEELSERTLRNLETLGYIGGDREPNKPAR